MILAVDIGNTNIKIGAWDKDKLVFVSRLQTVALKTQDEYSVNLVDIFRLNNYNAAQFDGAIIASVVPALSLPFKCAVKSVLQLNRLFVVSPGLKSGLNNKIENPAVLGADSVCCAVAAAAKYPMPCVIIIMGTATVISALDKRGAYLGCAVAPGVVISMEALAERTAQLPHISMDSPGPLIGVNTVDSMKSGSIYGAACMLDGMVKKMRHELGGSATVVAGGGIAPFIIGFCEEEIIYDDALILEGLRIIYEKNTN
jgi:type III pantothenate kinase